MLFMFLIIKYIFTDVGNSTSWIAGNRNYLIIRTLTWNRRRDVMKKGGKIVNNLQKFLDKFLAPIAKWMGNNLFFSSLADAFMKVTPITLGGAFVLLIGNFPIPAWTNFLQKIGWATQFNAAQNATMNVLSLFVVFNFAYVYAEKCKYNPLPAGLLAASSFMILAPQDYMARAFGTHAKLTQVTAFGTNYLGSSGMVVAILVGWVVGMLYVFLNKKNIVIKLPDSVPPNVAASLQPSLIAGIILVLMTLIRGAFSYTAFGNIFDCVTNWFKRHCKHLLLLQLALLLFTP